MPCKCYSTFQYAISVEEHGLELDDGQLLSLPSQLLLDYNDLQKVPFYHMLDNALNNDGLKLRYAAQIRVLFFFFFLFLPFRVKFEVLMLCCGFIGLIPWER